MSEMAGMRPEFAAALRDELLDYVERSARSAWRRRVWIGTLTVGGIVLAGAGAATATLSLLPGAPIVATLGTPITSEHAGAATIELGPIPEGATHITVELTCLSAGRFAFPDGSGLSCTKAQTGSTASVRLPLTPEQSTVAIAAGSEQRWKLSAAYVNTTTTPWAINAAGESYGIANEAGSPDLVAVVATNGREGYVRATELAVANGTTAAESFESPDEALAWQEEMAGITLVVAVYASDGRTRLGDFAITYAE